MVARTIATSVRAGMSRKNLSPISTKRVWRDPLLPPAAVAGRRKVAHGDPGIAASKLDDARARPAPERQGNDMVRARLDEERFAGCHTQACAREVDRQR